MYAFRGAHEAREHKQKKVEYEPGVEHAAFPSNEAVARRQATRSALTELELRRQVLLDLAALMNCIALESTQSLSEHEYARRSILNFGCPDISTRTIDETRLSEVREELECALRTYEPRLIAETLRVNREAVADDDLRLRYVVRADLACIPVSVPVQFVADVELDSGAISVHRL
jgi:type VI secretion system protein ImpF